MCKFKMIRFLNWPIENFTLFKKPFSTDAAFTDNDLGMRIVFSKITTNIWLMHSCFYQIKLALDYSGPECKQMQLFLFVILLLLV